jgi:hypothetical protein
MLALAVHPGRAELETAKHTSAMPASASSAPRFPSGPLNELAAYGVAKPM